MSWRFPQYHWQVQIMSHVKFLKTTGSPWRPWKKEIKHQGFAYFALQGRVCKPKKSVCEHVTRVYSIVIGVTTGLFTWSMPYNLTHASKPSESSSVGVKGRPPSYLPPNCHRSHHFRRKPICHGQKEDRGTIKSKVTWWNQGASFQEKADKEVSGCPFCL